MRIPIRARNKSKVGIGIKKSKQFFCVYGKLGKDERKVEKKEGKSDHIPTFHYHFEKLEK